MPAILANIPPTERRALRIQATGATVGAATNTNVILFTGAAAQWQSLVSGVPGSFTYPIGTTFVAPVAGSGNWINVASDAQGGTQFKFNRRGTYQVDIYADGDAGVAATTVSQLGVTLDQAAAVDVVATGTLAVLSDSVLGWQTSDAVAAAAIPLHVSVPVYISDFQANGAQPSANGTTTRGVGVLRFTANNGAGAVVADAWVEATIRATIVYQGDVAG